MLVDMPTSVPENFAIADSVLQNAAAFVKTELAGNDSSHDFFHIERVRNMAVKIARSEDMSEQDVRVIELAALLHDVKDWKYGGTESEARACIEVTWLFSAVHDNMLSGQAEHAGLYTQAGLCVTGLPV